MLGAWGMGGTGQDGAELLSTLGNELGEGPVTWTASGGPQEG